MNFYNILAVGIGGFLGSISRYYIKIIVEKNYPYDIPLATLIVNLSGSLFIGLCFAIFMHYEIPNFFKLFIITGFLGALTTYSAFSIESVLLFETSWYYAIVNIILNLFGSILFAYIGYKISLYFIKI